MPEFCLSQRGLNFLYIKIPFAAVYSIHHAPCGVLSLSDTSDTSDTLVFLCLLPLFPPIAVLQLVRRERGRERESSLAAGHDINLVLISY